MKDTRLVVHKQVFVNRTVDDAFRIFTEEIASWWPLRQGHSVFGDESDGPVMECRAGGRIHERSKQGAEAEWGSVLECDAPHMLRVRWHPGADTAQATEFTVRFTPAPDGGTTVDLVHTGWEQFGEEAAARRENYDTGWDLVLGRFTARA